MFFHYIATPKKTAIHSAKTKTKLCYKQSLALGCFA